MTKISMNEIFFCFGIAIVIYLLLKECMKMKEGMTDKIKDRQNRIINRARKFSRNQLDDLEKERFADRLAIAVTGRRCSNPISNPISILPPPDDDKPPQFLTQIRSTKPT